jgi:fibronectin type 3 domain-containing protein
MVKGKRNLAVSLALVIILGLFAGATFVSNAFDLGNSYIISSANSKIVHAETGKKDALTATASAVTDAEAFEVVNNTDGTVSFLCKITDSYIAPHDNGHSELVTKKNNSFTDWQKFTLEQQADGTVAIKSVKTNKYVTVDLSDGATLSASRTTVGTNEKFTIVTPKNPAAPAEVIVSSKTLDSVSLSWAADTNITGYNVYRSATSDGTYEKLNTSAIAATSYTDTGLTPVTAYFYTVSAVNLLGESAQSSSVSVTTLSAAPTGLIAGVSTNSSVSLTWSETAGAASYNVYRSAAGDGIYTKLNTGPVTSTGYTDTGLNAGNIFDYKVSAVSAGGESALSSSITLKTFPAAPAGLGISSITADSISLNWAAAAGASSYNIYRAPSRFGTYGKLNSDPITATSYIDTGLASIYYYYKVESVNESGKSDLSASISEEIKLLGPNVYVFAPTDSAADIQTICSNLFTQQESAQFNPNRYAILFRPGMYTTNVKVGFYTQVAGLGRLPDDVNLNSLTVDANWMPDNNATCNFWRAAENLSVNTDMTWAVSQAAPLRRVHLKKKLSLFVGSGWSSGGFLSDSKVDGQIVSGSQQQWFTRNTNLAGGWNGGVWNMVFVGAINTPAGDWSSPSPKPNTVVSQTPVVAEKPFLTIDSFGNYSVFVPALQRNSLGTTWEGGFPLGNYIPIDQFYVAHPETDTAATINDALTSGKNLLLTPGIYHLDATIHVTLPNTVILGLGLATLTPDNGVIAMSVADVDGVRIAGILYDAGATNSPMLLQVGPDDATADHSSNPTIISDIIVRIGGPILANATTGLEINSNNVVGDDFWVWRADHGAGYGWKPGNWTQSTWYTDTATNGMIVNGNNVTMYGLMVEHFQQYQTVWNGNGGRTYFYQSEMPYDIPDQASWMSHGNTVNGYASYKVADSVTTHETWGFGIYSYFRDAVVKANSAMEVPNTPNVKAHNTCSVFLSGNGEITHVINNTGAVALSGNIRQTVNEYCNNVDQPVISLPSGTYLGEQAVTITCPDPMANIMYTTDGSTPTASHGTPYSSAITVSSNMTLKAVACKPGMNDSIVASATYGIVVPQPVISPPSGTYTEAQTVTITCPTSGVTIMYTTDGSIPTASHGTVYTGPFTVSSSVEMRAIAIKAGMSNSKAARAIYTIGTPILVNLAWNKPVIAFSQQQGGNEAYKIDDEDLATRWGCANAGFPNYVTIDLGSIGAISNFEVYPYNGSSRTYQYKIEGSNDGVNFSIIVDRTANTVRATKLVDTLPNLVSARYVKITVTGCVGGSYSTLYELKVFGYQQ